MTAASTNAAAGANEQSIIERRRALKQGKKKPTPPLPVSAPTAIVVDMTKPTPAAPPAAEAKHPRRGGWPRHDTYRITFPSKDRKHNLNGDPIRYTRRVWQPRLGRNLSREDVRQITENFTGFFTLLAKWSPAERATAVNDNDRGLSTNTIVNEEQPTVGGDGGFRDHD
jgi:hypothetical protein